MAATLLQFAAVNDAAALTTKKLQKQEILADYFRSLDDADLPRAVRFAAGRAFAGTDGRSLNVGGAILSDAVLSMITLSAADYRLLVIRSGEIGEALREAMPARPVDSPLTLAELARAFDELAAASQAVGKRRVLLDLFGRCGSPAEAAYIAKIISGDLRTGVQEGVLQAAIAVAFETTLAAVQRCQLLVGDLDEVALLARHRTLESARFKLFHPIQMMLATPQETADAAAATLAGRTYFAEDKLDGIRAQVHKQGDRIEIFTRTLERADGSFPDVVAAVSRLPGDFLLDGEIVPWRDGQVLPFAHIQKRLGRKLPTAKMLRENPAVFIPFDLLYRDQRLLLDSSWQARRGELESLLNQGPHAGIVAPLQPTPVITAAEITAAFERSREARNEGLILKDPESIYSPGRRGKMWLKLKTHLPTFDCVVTAAEHGHGKRRESLSDYTFAVWTQAPDEPGAELVNIGKAYSGVTDEEIEQLTKLFQELSLEFNGRVHRVKPQLVLEIAADQIQPSQRHRSGYALRFPRIKRIRWDKRPEDADLLSRVVEVYQSHANFGQVPVPPPPEPTLFDGLM